MRNLTNATKWLVALPFTFLLAFGVPGLIAGRLLWFMQDWGDLAHVLFTAGMWLLATAFVDVTSERVRPDRLRRWLTLGLIASGPLAVADRVCGPAAAFTEAWRTAGLVVCVSAAFLGISARISLGRYYTPNPTTLNSHALVTAGPYRWIRHPMYAAALLWGIGWPLLVRSAAGAVFLVAVTLPFLVIRIRQEESELTRVLGDDYTRYQERSWKLIPFLF